MSASHHGAFPNGKGAEHSSQLSEMLKRFESQVNGTAKREYSQGRISAEDDGDLVMAMTTDVRKGVIIIRFGKPTEWIGLGLEEAVAMRDGLTRRIMELRGVPVEA